MNWKWQTIYWAPEDGEGGGGSGDGDGGAGGDADGAGAGNQGGTGSLRSQLAASLDEGDRTAFSKWADSYTTDKDFTRGALTMRSQFDGRVPIPTDKSKPEEVDAFWQRVGKPKGANEYTFDWGKDENGKPHQLDDDEAARLEEFKTYAHQNHYTQGQFESGIKFLQADTEKREAAFSAKIQKARDAAEGKLKQDWGPDFDDNLAFAEEAGAAFADDQSEWVSFVNLPLADGTRVGDHVTLIKTMAKIGRMNGEDQRLRTMHQSGEADTVKQQIEALEQEALDKVGSTSVEPYHSRLNALYQKLYPKKHSGATAGMGFGGRG